MRSESAARGLGAWAEFARLRQILGEWGLPLAALTAIAARPPLARETAWAAVVWFAIAVFSHLINDLEDAGADRLGVQRSRNPVATGTIGAGTARGATVFLGVISLLGAFTLPASATAFAVCVWMLGALYSWRRIRLKAIPGADLLSHGLMAGATVLLFAGLDGSVRDAATWVIACGVSVFSAGGGLHNQLRDRHTDQRAGIHNTTALLGAGKARRLRWALHSIGVVAIGVGVALVIRLVSAPTPS